MGTTASPVSSSSSSSTTAPTFNGSSQYASDLQQAITHAVTIASIPLDQLQSSVSRLQSQQNELTTLQNDFSGIQSAVQSLATATTGSGSLSASVSNPSVVSASLSSTATITPGTYTVDVQSLGSPTTALSATGVADPSSGTIGAGGNYTLTVNGGTPVTISPSANTLEALSQAINSADAGVSATIVNVGSPSSPDYELSLQSTALGDIPITLKDSNNTSLLGFTNPGAQTEYQVDGQPSASPYIQTGTNSVTIAPGVTVDLLDTGIATINVAPDPTAASNALSAFVSAYNTAVSDLDQNTGKNGGALSGQSTVFQLQQSLNALAQYNGGSGSVTSLVDLGLTFNQSGQLTFDASQFDSVSASDPADVSALLGSATGGGFLEMATNLLNGLNDPTTGTFQNQQVALQQNIDTDNQEIATQQARINTLQANVTAQMAAADSAIAALEQQVTYFTSLFTATQDAIQAQSLA